MNFYVYGDLHTHTEAAERFLQHEKPSKTIWLGDMFDLHADDGPQEMIKTCLWLKDTMAARPQDVFLLGNHELAYFYPETDKYKICGWTPTKHKAFLEFFPQELKSCFKLYHIEEWGGQKVVFSHAGLNPSSFPFGKFDATHLERIAKIALDNAHKQDYNPLLDNWGGRIVWQRWQNFPLLEGVSQVCGHTVYANPQIRAVAGKPEWNLCLDCAHTYYAVFKKKAAYAINRHNGMEHLLRFEVK